jgi:type VI secretion system secreted protein Hcp
MAIYMQYDNGSISGDVTDQAFKGWIELNSFQWGIGRGITSPTSGSEADREASLPSVSEVVVTKNQDSASGNVMRAACATGDFSKGKTVMIAFVRAGTGGGSEMYLQYELDNTLVSGWSQSSGGDRPSESLTLNFTKISFTYTPSGPTNTSNSPDTPTYDLAAQKGT